MQRCSLIVTTGSNSLYRSVALAAQFRRASCSAALCKVVLVFALVLRWYAMCTPPPCSHGHSIPCGLPWESASCVGRQLRPAANYVVELTETMANAWHRRLFLNAPHPSDGARVDVFAAMRRFSQVGMCKNKTFMKHETQRADVSYAEPHQRTTFETE